MKGHVLIIDDEPEIRRNLTFGLAQEGYQVTACPDGISAIHELDASRRRGVGYDYLVTDIFMPDIDGLKILKVIKNQFPDLPVLVITGFGDDRLKFTAMSEQNTGYLDKPFEISELVRALEALSPGVTTLEPSKKVEAEEDLSPRESVSAYMTVRIGDPARSMEIYRKLYHMDGVASCHAVRGDVDIILLGQASSEEGIQRLREKIQSMEGMELVSMSPVERPKLDRDVNEFVRIYQETVKQAAHREKEKQPGTTSYIIVDIDKNFIQQIFTTVSLIDEIVFCDVIDGGSRIVGMITGRGAVGKTPQIINKISQIDGVLRIREAQIIKLLED